MSDNDHENGQAKVSLVSVTRSAVPDFVDIQAAAFKFDQFSNLMTLGRDESAHKSLLRKSIELWMSDLASQLVMAVHANGDVVGWACWVLKGGSGDGKEEGPGGNDAALAGGQAEANQREATTDPPRVLGALMLKDVARWEDEHMKGRRYMVLQALFTHPRYQGRGIGSKLVQWGIDRAEAEGLACWLHASPAGYGLYKRAGFREVGKSDYDLDEWAPGGKGGNRGWGRYTFRYMLRQSNSSL